MGDHSNYSCITIYVSGGEADIAFRDFDDEGKIEEHDFCNIGAPELRAMGHLFVQAAEVVDRDRVHPFLSEAAELRLRIDWDRQNLAQAAARKARGEE